MEETYLVFRSPESIDELKSLLLVRHAALCEHQASATRTSYGIELDEFDVRSLHFGFFLHEKRSSRPVGYARLVTESETSFAPDVRSIASSIPAMFSAISATPYLPFPLMYRFPGYTDVSGLFVEWSRNGKHIAEIERISLDRSIRSCSLNEALVASTVAACIVHGFSRPFIAAPARCLTFYESFGFRKCDSVNNANAEVHCMMGDPDHAAEELRDHIVAMAEAYFTTHRICHNPANSNQVYAPMSSYIPSRHAFRAAA